MYSRNVFQIIRHQKWLVYKYKIIIDSYTILWCMAWSWLFINRRVLLYTWLKSSVDTAIHIFIVKWFLCKRSNQMSKIHYLCYLHANKVNLMYNLSFLYVVNNFSCDGLNSMQLYLQDLKFLLHINISNILPTVHKGFKILIGFKPLLYFCQNVLLVVPSTK